MFLLYLNPIIIFCLNLLYLKFISDSNYFNVLHQSNIESVFLLLKPKLTAQSQSKDIFVIFSLCDSSFKIYKTKSYIDSIVNLPQKELYIISNLNIASLVGEDINGNKDIHTYSEFELHNFIQDVYNYTIDSKTDYSNNSFSIEYNHNAKQTKKKQASSKIFINKTNIFTLDNYNNLTIVDNKEEAKKHIHYLLNRGIASFKLFVNNKDGKMPLTQLNQFGEYFANAKRKISINNHYYISKLAQILPFYSKEINLEIIRLTPSQFINFTKTIAKYDVTKLIKRISVIKLSADTLKDGLYYDNYDKAEFWDCYKTLKRKNPNIVISAIYVYGYETESRSDFDKLLSESENFNECEFYFYSHYSKWYRKDINPLPASEVLYRTDKINQLKSENKNIFIEGNKDINIIYKQIHRLISPKPEVLLIFPKSIKNNRISNPLTLSMLSTGLVKEGISVEILDERNETDLKAVIKHRIEQNTLLCIGITSFTGHQLSYLLETCRFIKEISNIPVIMGGYHATLFPEQCIKEKSIDYVLQGEGESSFLEFVKNIKKGISIENIKGIVYKNGQENIKINEPEMLPLNNNYDLPMYLLIKDNYKYTHIFFETARGCLYNCSYCAVSTIYKSKYRPKPVAQALNDIKRLTDSYPDAYYHFTDDNFLTYTQHTENFLKQLIEQKRTGNIKFKKAWIQCRADILLKLSDEMIMLLKEAGLTEIFIGAESGSNRILKLLNKHLSVEQIIEANLKMAKHKEFILQYSFMTNLPTETEDEKQKTIDLIEKILNDNPNACVWEINSYVPYPGTELHKKYYKGELPSTIDKWAELDWYSGEEKLDIETKMLY